MVALVPGRKSHNNPVASVSNIQEIVSGLKAEEGRMPIDQPVRMLVLEELNWERFALKMTSSVSQYLTKVSKKSVQQAYQFLTYHDQRNKRSEISNIKCTIDA